MSAQDALAKARAWACENLTDSQAGKLCGMLSEVSRENAKLWELVKAFDWCTENFDMQSKCDRCPLEQNDKLTPECEVRMRELGMEVKS